jgi:hypothetical protein
MKAKTPSPDSQLLSRKKKKKIMKAKVFMVLFNGHLYAL